MSTHTENTTLPAATREIRLASRPHGRPVPENFQLAESPLPELQEGQVLVRNQFISVDPYMRGRMNDVKSYSAPFELDRAMEGGAVGEVIASRSADRKVGDVVVHSLGWREYAVLDAAATTVARTDLAPASAFLGALGMTGLTAWAGLLKVAEFKPGEGWRMVDLRANGRVVARVVERPVWASAEAKAGKEAPVAHAVFVAAPAESLEHSAAVYRAAMEGAVFDPEANQSLQVRCRAVE